ncbi:MAG: hypothetical protein QXP36_00425 [Conexivisphaerales archaeon]
MERRIFFNPEIAADEMLDYFISTNSNRIVTAIEDTLNTIFKGRFLTKQFMEDIGNALIAKIYKNARKRIDTELQNMEHIDEQEFKKMFLEYMIDESQKVLTKSIISDLALMIITDNMVEM